jgi:hypothetical protein
MLFHRIGGAYENHGEFKQWTRKGENAKLSQGRYLSRNNILRQERGIYREVKDGKDDAKAKTPKGHKTKETVFLSGGDFLVSTNIRESKTKFK